MISLKTANKIVDTQRRIKFVRKSIERLELEENPGSELARLVHVHGKLLAKLNALGDVARLEIDRE